jgi:hypothetical protein
MIEERREIQQGKNQIAAITDTRTCVTCYVTQTTPSTLHIKKMNECSIHKNKSVTETTISTSIRP